MKSDFNIELLADKDDETVLLTLGSNIPKSGVYLDVEELMELGDACHKLVHFLEGENERVRTITIEVS